MRHLVVTALILLGLSAGAPAREAVGVNVHLPPDDELGLAAELGVGWIRIDNNWITVEPEEGRRRFEELDRVVDGARARGLAVFMTIAYAPAWATEPDGDGVATNDVPRAGTYARYVTAVVEHFRDRVTHYGLWNEPNLDHFFEGSVDQYLARVLRPGAEAVRAACPACRVLGPDLAGVSGWQPYLEQVLRGAPGAFDILTHHTYAAVPGTRAGLWACDDFEHALDIGDDAICFYKPGLRQVLDQAGWQGEVWITETGYRTRPWDDAGEQERQRRTVEGVLARQLATPWWTGTFFYELSDCGAIIPDCDIDGYGLLRRGAGAGGGAFLKPAYTWLRDELARNPAWREDAEPPPPPPAEGPRIAVPHRPEGVPDGQLDDWDDAGCVVLSRYEALVDRPAGAEDLSARACAAWSDQALWLAVEVRDDQHVNDFPDDTLWLGDSVQLGLDPDGDAAPGAGYDEDDGEWTLALARGESRLRVEQGALGALGRVVVEGDRARYELRIPMPGLAAGDELRASFLVNENDTGERGGFLEWTPGIGRQKEPAAFGVLALVDRQAVPDPDAGVMADAGHRPPPPPPGVPDVGAADAGRGLDLGPADAASQDAQGSADTRVAEDGGVARARDDEGCQQQPGSIAGLWLLAVLALARRRRITCRGA